MTPSTDSVPADVLAEIRQAQLDQADELKVIKGQLADLPGISNRLANTRLDLRHDVGELREQAAELPGIRARLEEQDCQLAEIKNQLATIISLLSGPIEVISARSSRRCAAGSVVVGSR